MVASLCSQKAAPLWTSRPSWEGLAIKTGWWRSGGFGRRCRRWVLDLGKMQGHHLAVWIRHKAVVKFSLNACIDN